MAELKRQKNLSQSEKLSRRGFMTRTAQVGAILMAPTIIPASVLGKNGAVPPSERIVFAGIGIGNRGEYDLRMLLRENDVQFVATCDPQKSRAEKIKKVIDSRYDNTDCVIYRNTNQFLAERPDVDAVLITTGDRMHAYASTMAMRAGKDVYSEKPSSMTIAEGQAVTETAKRYGRVYQTGTQRLSEANFTFANEILRLGRLGKVHTVRAHIAPWDAAEMSYDWMPEEKLPTKEEVDWDQWLGPCPWRPYNSKYVSGGWRGFYDFHTSCIGEWGAHTFAQCQIAIDAKYTSAIEYGYVNNPTGDGMVTKFANGIQMILQLDKDNKYFHGSCAVRYEGPDGWITIGDGYDKPEVSSPALLADFDKIVKDYSERTERPMNHWRNYVDSIKSRKPAVADAEMMHRTMTTVHAANICMWLKRDMKYDPIKEEFINDPEANRLRTRAMREPWIF